MIRTCAPAEAAINAARLRLRPILMTSFAFILGVLPLLVATGAGAEMRQALGTVVFYGMIGVTVFGLFVTPVFYTVIRKLGGDKPIIAPHQRQEPANGPSPSEPSLVRLERQIHFGEVRSFSGIPIALAL